MPERTTEEYEGVPSAKVQQAIQAILQDDSSRENVPIETLINFEDSILSQENSEGGLIKSRSSTSTGARPKSGKRPKSAKKKKAVE